MTLHDFLVSNNLVINDKYQSKLGWEVYKEYLKEYGVKPKKTTKHSHRIKLRLCNYPEDFLNRNIEKIIEHLSHIYK